MNKHKIKKHLSSLLSCLFIANIFIGSFFVNIFNSYSFDNSITPKITFGSKNINKIAQNTFVFETSTSKNLKVTLSGIKITENSLDFRLNYNQLVSYIGIQDNSNILTKSIEKSFNISNLLSNISKHDTNLSIHKDTEFFTCNNSSVFVYKSDKKFEQQSFFSSRAPPLLFI